MALSIFDKISFKEQWADPLKLYAPFRLQFLLSSLKAASDLKKKKLLDVGCGPGYLSELLVEKGAEVTAIDTSKETINLCKKRMLTKHHLTILNTSPEELLLIENNKELYDLVIASEVLEHVDENPSQFLNSLISLLKPKGYLFITCPNRTLFSRFTLIFLAERLFQICPRGTHEFKKFIHIEDLKKYVLNSSYKRKRRFFWNYGGPHLYKSDEHNSLRKIKSTTGVMFFPFINKWVKTGANFNFFGYMCVFQK